MIRSGPTASGDNRVLEPPAPRANRAARRACAKRGHRWKHFGDNVVRCVDCGEQLG